LRKFNINEPNILKMCTTQFLFMVLYSTSKQTFNLMTITTSIILLLNI